MQMDGKVQLPYTLQTMVGMVLNNGLPVGRYYRGQSRHGGTTLSKTVPLEPGVVAQLPKVLKFSWHANPNQIGAKDRDAIATFKDFCAIDWKSEKYKPVAEGAAASIRTGKPLDWKCVKGTDDDAKRYMRNIVACRRPDVDVYRLSSLIKCRTRMDLEQAAAAVVSAFVSAGRSDDAALLLAELTGVLATSDMASPEDWQELTSRNTLADSIRELFANLGQRTKFWCERSGKEGLDTPRNYNELVHLFLRIRSRRKRDRCLYIPAWMFDEAEIEPPPHHRDFLRDNPSGNRANGNGLLDRYPELPPEPGNAIVVSKHGFRVIQRRIFRVFRFWDPTICLRREIRSLEDSVKYASQWIEEQLRNTDDIAEVAHWFFLFQRRLQLKVVSDEEWTTFLAKGVGATVYQNNLALRSTFEEVLRCLAGKTEEESLGSREKTMDLINRTCLLMKSYVDVYGDGNKENLIFKKGVSGGSGRGPVDEYNALCDVMSELKKRAKNEGIERVPGPVYKFLAKDIMAWNQAWEDDAFAGGKVHGWEDWVQELDAIGSGLSSGPTGARSST